ncbi:uncharacterized protein LOC128991998 [Macrosteles quadrilineatus]|uniref:uncharacterized protein LOC128991998 n=1 Tax=Macrosteles quadrilineatus TaxID=74068 RepID=UPI0023E2BFBB|nr:uncharacterized protein LOC128991998 [Macrosteles quadrilineatus]
MFLLGLLAVCCTFRFSLAIVDFCDVDRRNSSVSSPGIQFTKELSTSEYAVVSSFKSLHCCAKGYRSIEWFKDGKAYPWPGDVSSFILYPESANQTIYSQALGAVDAGNYSCRVANDSRLVTHTTSLTVFVMKKNYMNMPLPTYNMPAEHFVKIGQTARLFCEAFVGKIDLPDANNEILWERPDFNMSSPDAKRYKQRNISREEGQVVGAYLVIERVSHSDFGEYVCSISNTGDQVLRLSTLLREHDWEMEMPSNKIPWLKLQFMVLCLLVVVTLAVVYKRFALAAALYIKLKISSRPVDDGKEHDVLVCYAADDTDFAVGVLATTLETRYNYTVTLCQLNNARVSAELQLASSLSRRLLVILSPAMFEGQWSPSDVCPLFRQLTELHPNIIYIPLKALHVDASWKTEEGMELRRLMSKCAPVVWPAQGGPAINRRNFWISLRLRMPPPPPPSPATGAAIPATNKAKLSTFAKSNESLEVLV